MASSLQGFIDGPNLTDLLSLLHKIEVSMFATFPIIQTPHFKKFFDSSSFFILSLQSLALLSSSEFLTPWKCSRTLLNGGCHLFWDYWKPAKCKGSYPRVWKGSKEFCFGDWDYGPFTAQHWSRHFTLQITILLFELSGYKWRVKHFHYMGEGNQTTATSKSLLLVCLVLPAVLYVNSTPFPARVVHLKARSGRHFALSWGGGI